MKLLINKKSFTPFTLFTLVTSFTPFTLSKQGKVNDGKRSPFTAFMCQPCRFDGKVNEVNGVTRKCNLGEILGKRSKITPFTTAGQVPVEQFALQEVSTDLETWQDWNCAAGNLGRQGGRARGYG